MSIMINRESQMKKIVAVPEEARSKYTVLYIVDVNGHLHFSDPYLSNDAPDIRFWSGTSIETALKWAEQARLEDELEWFGLTTHGDETHYIDRNKSLSIERLTGLLVLAEREYKELCEKLARRERRSYPKGYRPFKDLTLNM